MEMELMVTARKKVTLNENKERHCLDVMHEDGHYLCSFSGYALPVETDNCQSWRYRKAMAALKRAVRRALEENGIGLNELKIKQR